MFVAMLPTMAFVLVFYLGRTAWTVYISFTSSKILPNTEWVGGRQYERLLKADLWWVAVHNILIFGALYIAGCLVLGFLDRGRQRHLEGAEGPSHRHGVPVLCPLSAHERPRQLAIRPAHAERVESRDRPSRARGREHPEIGAGRLGVAERMAACIEDPRASKHVTHSMADIIRFRLLMIRGGL